MKSVLYAACAALALIPAAAIADVAKPAALVADGIPPVSDVAEIQITRPEIYFGEDSLAYIVVNTDEPEFDYPSGDNNVYSEYQGGNIFRTVPAQL